MTKNSKRGTVTQPTTLARLGSAILPLIVAACSSSEPGAPYPGAALLVVSGFPSSVTTGAPVTGTVTAKDASGNTAFGYIGTVHVTSTDPAAQLPPNHTFAAADRGSYTFTATFQTAGNQTVTATDEGPSSVYGSETFTVTPSHKASDVFAVGGNGTILHYDGASWTPQTSGTALALFGVWGVSGSDVFAVGQHGIVLHYDGTRWAVQPTQDTSRLAGVWGSSDRDVFAVGDDGTILHFDGTTWTRQMRDTTLWLSGVWGSSGSNVFAVGGHGTILHYNGTDWLAQRRDPTIDLFGVWGASETDVFAVGDSILRYDGTNWSAQRIAAVFGVWGSSANDLYAVGDYGSIMHYNGTSWTLQDCSYCYFAAGWPGELDGVWGISSSDVFAVGMGGGIVHYDGTRWAEQSTGTTAYLWGVWGSSRTR